MHCLWCQERFLPTLDLKWLFSLKKITDNDLCQTCAGKLIVLSEQTCCVICNKMMNEKKICAECQLWREKYPHNLLENKSLYRYNDFLKEWMQQYKFKQAFHLRGIFSKQVKYAVEKYTHFLCVPIPITKERLAERGFNQVTSILEDGHVTYFEALSKKESSERQSIKNKQQRLSTEQPFQMTIAQEKNIRNKKILLIDDIYTTGRTLYHASNRLLNAGAKEVKSLTIAR